MYMFITRPKNKYQAEIDSGAKEFREDHQELIEEHERGEKILANIEKFKAEHEARSKKLAELWTGFEEKMSDPASKVESEDENIDSMIAEAAKEFDGATFEVDVDSVISNFYKRCESRSLAELEIILKITNQKTDEREEIECREEITIYPYDGQVELDEGFFSALKGKIPTWQIQAVCAEVKEYLEDPENERFWDMEF